MPWIPSQLILDLYTINFHLTSFIHWPTLDSMWSLLDSLTLARGAERTEKNRKDETKATGGGRKRRRKTETGKERDRQVTQSFGSANECTAAGGGSSTGSCPHNRQGLAGCSN